MRLIRKGSGSMKKIFTVLFSICLFMMGVSASNESPTVKSELKDGSLDFKVTLTDMDLSTSTEYQWTIVKNQAATPEDNAWSTVNEWTTSSMNFNLDFITQAYQANNIQKVVGYVDTAYLIIREKESGDIITDHVAVDVSIPFAYGAVPYYRISSSDKTTNWYQNELFSICMTCGSAQKFTAVKITNQDIIDGYETLKNTDGEIDDAELIKYVDSLGLKDSDIPTTFKQSFDSSYLHFGGYTNKQIGIEENAIYFVWGAYSYESSKTIYGVTIYDNRSEDVITNDNTEKEVTVEETKEEVKEEAKEEVKEEKTVENPKTGIITLGIGAVVLLGISVTIYFIIRKKSKFPQSL